MWIGDHVLNDCVPPRPIRVGNPEAQGMGVRPLDPGGQMTLLLVYKRLSIRGHILDVTQLRAVNSGIEDFGHDAAENREPKAAAARVGSAYAVLIALRPFGFDSRLPECRPPGAPRVHADASVLLSQLSRLFPVPADSLFSGSAVRNAILRSGTPATRHLR